MSPAPTTMLYKLGSTIDIEGTKFDYLIVEDKDIETAIGDGWFLTVVDAKDSAKIDLKSVESEKEEQEIKRRGRPPKSQIEG